MHWLLFIAVLQPALVAILLGLLPLKREQVRVIALGSTLVSLLCTAVLCLAFDPQAAARPQFVWAADWVGEGGVRFALGVDGLSLWLLPLSALLTAVAVLSSWESVVQGARAFYSLLLLLETGMLGVFAALDIVLFYVFFEFTLIPLFFIIGIWGGPERRFAAVKFLIYTFAGSVLTAAGLLYVVVAHYSQHAVWTFDIPTLVYNTEIPAGAQMALFLALFAGFAIKVPVFPFHTWLPLAHVEAPTAGSVLLAGVLLKLGTYGFARFSLPLVPAACLQAFPWIAALAVIGIIYGALTAMAQDDIKRLVAYSSISHMGFCVLGLFAFNHQGIAGGVLQMVNHGLATGALFAIVGMLYERYHTRMIADYGGLARLMPRLAVLTVVIVLASVGLPGLNGFVGEVLVLLGAFKTSRAAAVLATAGIVLGAYYMLTLLQRAFFGQVREPDHDERETGDLRWHELAALVPVAVACFWIGLWPGFFVQRMMPAIDVIVNRADQVTQGQAGVHSPFAPRTETAHSGTGGEQNRG